MLVNDRKDICQCLRETPLWDLASEAKPTAIDPCREEISPDLEDLTVGCARMMQPDELEHFPKAVIVFRHVAEQICFEWCEVHGVIRAV